MRKASGAKVRSAGAVRSSALSQGPFTCLPMTSRFLPPSMTSTMRGGARSPLSGASARHACRTTAEMIHDRQHMSEGPELKGTPIALFKTDVRDTHFFPVDEGRRDTPPCMRSG